MRNRRGNRTTIRARCAAALLIASWSIAAPAFAEHKTYVDLESPTLRNGGHESIRIAAPDFPAYGGHGWDRVPGVYPVATEALLGTAAVAYRSGAAIVFEVMLFHSNAYLNAIVFYDDGKTPALYVKKGQGAVFEEEPIDPRWTPSRLFPGFERDLHL